MSRFWKKGIFFICLIVTFYLLRGCTILKMGSLFLSGEAGRKNFIRETDFQYTGGLIFLQVGLNDLPRKYSFIFDTGAAFNVISTRVAEDIGVDAVAEDTIKDAAQKTEEIKFAKIPKVTIAGIPFTDTAAGIMDVDANPRLKCYHIEGVIGANLMRLVNCWKIDFQRKKITFSDHTDLAPGGKAAVTIPFKKNIQRIPRLDVELSGRIKIQCAVDLGSTGGLNLDFPTFQKIRKTFPGIRIISATGETGGGALGSGWGKTYFFPLEKVRVGGASMGPLLAGSTPDSFSSIGSGFFQDYTVSFNWNKKRMTLLPYSTDRIPLSFSTFGFGLGHQQSKKVFVVNFLYQGAPAEKSGLRLEDIILSIDGKKMENITGEDYCRYVLDSESLLGKDGTLTVTVRRDERTLTFQLVKEDLLRNI